jgi:acyl carrier protein
MTRPELNSRLTGLAALAFNQPTGLFTDSLRATDIPRWDSLNHVKLLITIEEDLDLEFTGADLKDPGNWGEFVDMVAAKLQARG